MKDALTEQQSQRLIDLLTSPAPDHIEVVDAAGVCWPVEDIVFITERGMTRPISTLKIVLCERREL